MLRNIYTDTVQGFLHDFGGGSDNIVIFAYVTCTCRCIAVEIL